MSFEFIRKLPTPTEVKNELPVPKNVAALKTQRDKEIADVLIAISVISRQLARKITVRHMSKEAKANEK